MEMIRTEGEMLAIPQRAARCSTRKHIYSAVEKVLTKKTKTKGKSSKTALISD